MSNAVEVIAIPAQAIAYLPAHGSVRRLDEPFATLMAGLQEAGIEPAGPPMARFDLDLRHPDDADFEVAVPIALAEDGSLPAGAGDIGTAVLPAHYALVTIHEGPYHEIGAGYTALTEELNSIGHAVTGPASEVYLTGSADGVPPSAYVTEVRVPIAR